MDNPTPLSKMPPPFAIPESVSASSKRSSVYMNFTRDSIVPKAEAHSKPKTDVKYRGTLDKTRYSLGTQ